MSDGGGRRRMRFGRSRRSARGTCTIAIVAAAEDPKLVGGRVATDRRWAQSRISHYATYVVRVNRDDDTLTLSEGRPSLVAGDGHRLVAVSGHVPRDRAVGRPGFASAS